MSEQELPDDVSRWPSDPHAVLGVAASDDRLAVKRAYTRLIRRFKPEQSPEQFQKVRAAYESVLQLLEWRERFQSQFPDAEQVDEEVHPSSLPALPAEVLPDDDEEFAAEASAAPRPSVPAPTSHPVRPEDVLEQAWKLATAGQPAQAYEALRQWHHQGSGVQSPRIISRGYCQLYWLATIFPEATGHDRPTEWLVKGLELTRRIGPLRELYVREIAREPREVVSDRFTRVLTAADPTLLESMLYVRWEAAAHLHQSCGVDVIADLAKFRERLLFDDESRWGRLLIAGIRRALAVELPRFNMINHCVNELESLPHLMREESYELDYLEFQQGPQRDWNRHLQVKLPSHWKRLILASDVYPPGTRNVDLQTIVAEIATGPAQALNILDGFAIVDPRGERELCGLLAAYCRQAGVEREVEAEPEIAPKLPSFLIYSPVDDPNFRGEFLKFCVTHALHPQVAAKYVGMRFASEVAEDQHLRLIYLTWKAFWSDSD